MGKTLYEAKDRITKKRSKTGFMCFVKEEEIVYFCKKTKQNGSH
jgi:hypothetical protein